MDNNKMENKTVKQLRDIAKENGLRGFWKLRKAELIKFLAFFLPPIPPPQILKIKPPVPPIPAPRKLKIKSPVPPIPAPRKLKIKPLVPPIPAPRKLKPSTQPPRYQLSKKQTRRENSEKRENKNNEAAAWKVPLQLNRDSSLHENREKERQAKRLKKKIQKVNRKVARNKRNRKQLLSKKQSLEIAYEKIKPKSTIAAHHRFELVESASALNQFATQYSIEGKKGYGPLSFLQAVKPTILHFLREHYNIKIKLILKCFMTKTDISSGEEVNTTAFLHSKMETVFKETNLDELYNKVVDKIMESLAKFQREGSGWVVDSIEELVLHTVKHNPLSGSSYIELPKILEDKKAVINMKNEDNQCFKWCVTRALNPVKKNAERISKVLRMQADELNWEGLKFPMELKEISRFETLNEVNVNVFGFENLVYPLRISDANHKKCVNLLLINENEKKHYCIIKDMSRLLSSQKSKNEHKKFFCLRCLNGFGSQTLLDSHEELCRENEVVRIKMPKEGSFVKFRNNYKKMDMPFVIYADFESLMRSISSVQPNPRKPYTEKKMLHIPISFCYYLKCSFDDNLSKVVEYTATSEDEDVSQIFVTHLEEEVKWIYRIPKKKMIFTKKDRHVYERSNKCWICEEPFSEKDKRVRDHCHYTGKFRGAAHNSCNLKFACPKFTPVIFHNLSGYDAHLFIKNLGVTEGNIDCIPNNEEKYISFTKHVEVERKTVKDEDENGEKKEKEVVINKQLRFIDSMKFMNSSLKC